MKTRLYLVRHGATAANLQRPYVLQGNRVDNPLSDTGRQQAECVATLFANHKITAVYASHLVRAQDTAATIAKPHNLPVHTLENIQEIDVGLWEGKSWIDIQRNHPDAHAAFIKTPGTTPYHGGESYDNVLNRVLPTFQHILQQHAGQEIVVVAHNVVNRAYVASLLHIPLDFARHIVQTNGGVNVIDFDNTTGEAQLRSLNADFHIPDSLK